MYRPYIPIVVSEQDIRRLQKFLHVPSDGKIGEQTITAMYYWIIGNKEYTDNVYKVPMHY